MNTVTSTMPATSNYQRSATGDETGRVIGVKNGGVNIGGIAFVASACTVLPVCGSCRFPLEYKSLEEPGVSVSWLSKCPSRGENSSQRAVVIYVSRMQLTDMAAKRVFPPPNHPPRPLWTRPNETQLPVSRWIEPQGDPVHPRRRRARTARQSRGCRGWPPG